MTAFFHPSLTQEKWSALPKEKQILNIATELHRASIGLSLQNTARLQSSLDRTLELIDLTGQDAKWSGGEVREWRRLREMLGEFYLGFNTSQEEFKQYIMASLRFHPSTSFVEL